MEGSGVHHLYVETHRWDESVAFWEAMGFRLDTDFAGRGDGILRPSSGPYVFLRLVPASTPLAFDVVLAADDLEEVAAQAGVTVTRPPYDAPWGPRMVDVADPDDRSFNVRENDGF